MLNKIIAFSLKNKLVVGLLTLAMAIWGVYNFIQLPIDAVPDITNNQVQVITISPSLAPQEVEQFVTFPVEVAMANIQDVVEIRSISRFGLSVVTIVFKDQVDIFKARQMVSEQIKMAENQIPSNYGRPEMMPITTGLGEIYQYVVEPRTGYEKVYSLYDLRTVQDWIIKRQLSGIPGIVDISTFGGWLKQYEVAVSPRKLVGMNITIPEIFEALEKNNQNSGGSYIEKRQNAYYIRTEGIVKSLGDIEKIVVKKISNIPITIGDIATVKIGAPPRFGAMTKDGKGEAVGGITLMLKGDNSSMVIARVKERMAKIQKMLPPGLEIKPYLDRSEMIRKTISTVTMNLLEGGLIVIFVLVLLLGNFRSGLVVASVIPLSMLFAISMMNIFGVSANLMSLGAIDFGLIVDGSVIVVEGIIHHLHKHFNNKKLTRDELDHTIYEASSRVGTAAVFGVIIILIVYVPIFAFTGIEGKMFKPMAQTVSFALVGALILSFTYVPMVSSLFLNRNVRVKEGFSDKIMNLLHRAHDRALAESLKRPVMVIVAALIFVVVSFWIFTRMGGEFLPTLEEGDLACQMTLTPGTSLSHSIATTTKVEEILLKQFPEVKHVVSKIGSAEIPTDPMAIEDADIMITMKPQKEWTSAKNREEMAEKMKAALGVLPGVSFDFSQPIQLRFNELMTGVKSDVAVKIFGEDLNLLFEKASIAAGIISKIRGAGDVKVEQIVGLPQLVVRFNRDKIARYGLTINEVNSIVRTAFAGQAAGLVFEGEKRFDLVVRLDEEHRKNMDALMSLRVNKPNEDLILLNQVADIEIVSGPMQISREETRRRITIGINVRNRDVESFIAEVNTALEKELSLPPGYSYTYGGQFENLESAKRTSAIAVPVALAAIFILLFFAFGSIKQSAMIFTAIPLAAVGGIWSLLIRGMPFSISAGVGFIALFGIAVLNGIVLISHYNQLEKEGVTDVLQRVIQGTYDRLRPVVMTSLVAALGFLPMAISTAAGAEVQKPLATVVIGGILTSSFLTLVVLPVLYLVFNAGFSCFLRERFRKKPPFSGSTATILLFLFLGGALQAQEKSLPVVLTMEDAVQYAVRNSTEFKTFELQKTAEQRLVKSAFNLNSPTLSLETGQINSSLKDYKLLISQNFEFPMVYAYQVSAQKAKSLSTEKLVVLKQQEMIAQVRSTYMKWWISKEKTELLRRQDSLFQVFSRAVSRQQSTGEAGRLSAVIADSRQARIEGRLRMSEAESDVLSNDLTVLIHASTPIALPAIPPERLMLLPHEGFSSDESSLAQYYDQEIRHSKANLRTESWKLAPSFSIGWFTQSIDETGPFTGMQYGISLPVWLWAPVGRIQSAKLHREITLNDRENSLHHLNARLFQLNREYAAAASRLDWFEKKGADHAGVYIEVAVKSFEAGETDLFESVFMLNEAFDLQMDYLDALNTYNQLVIGINQILGR
jgi:heavy metal efflux system protein